MKGLGMAITAFLAFAVFSSSLGLVYLKYQNRERWSERQRLQRDGDELEAEWGRLQLELAAWATAPRIERLARERLGMVTPAPKDIGIVRDE